MSDNLPKIIIIPVSIFFLFLIVGILILWSIDSRITRLEDEFMGRCDKHLSNTNKGE